MDQLGNRVEMGGGGGRRRYFSPHRLNMELELQSLFGLLCTAVLIGWDPATTPLPPHLGVIGQTRKTTSLCKSLVRPHPLLQQASGYWKTTWTGFLHIFQISYLIHADKESWVENLRPAMGARNQFQEPSLELSSQATWAGGPVRQPYAYLVPSPHSGTKVTDTAPYFSHNLFWEKPRRKTCTRIRRASQYTI